MGCGHEWKMFHITKPLAANTCVALPLVIARSLARTEVTCSHSTIWTVTLAGNHAESKIKQLTHVIAVVLGIQSQRQQLLVAQELLNSERAT